ncbi:hypothetical protein [Streptomyces sp. NPDC004267]|uniref:hypothetical protein n=1 Tax=Streptomyces sp. NPDC004267 TaxID=3364694 RepID=UPI0036A3C1DC
MRFLITDDSHRTLVAVDVPDTITVVVERADRPDLMYAGLDFHANGSLTVGHWPDGEEWQVLHHTEGVPSGSDSEVISPLPPEQYTLDAVRTALEVARDRANAFTHDAYALNILFDATLALLVNPSSQYPNPDDEANS